MLYARPPGRCPPLLRAQRDKLSWLFSFSFAFFTAVFAAISSRPRDLRFLWSIIRLSLRCGSVSNMSRECPYPFSK